jgi:glycerol-3-phosphate acyltransferase PlsY
VATLVLISVGGLIYTVGAVAYAFKRPNPFPGTFGFHEVFHLCTLVAAICHYIAVWLAVARIWKISSLGALSAMGASVIASVVITPGPVGIGILVIAAFVAMRHQENIERLVKGTEPRIGEGK